jgi:MFS family permease
MYKRNNKMSDIEDIEKTAQTVVDNVKEFFRGLLKKYWYLLVLVIIGIVGAFIGFVLVVLTFINNTGTPPIATWIFNQFSVGAVVLIAVLLFLWMLLLVVLPTVGYLGIIASVSWWKILSSDEKNTLKIWMKQEGKQEHRKKRMRRSGGGGGFGFITIVAFLIIVFINGNWWTHFENLPFSYFVITYLTGIIWMAIIAAIVGIIILILFLLGKLEKKK